jgi:hypothetical protein
MIKDIKIKINHTQVDFVKKTTKIKRAIDFLNNEVKKLLRV